MWIAIKTTTTKPCSTSLAANMGAFSLGLIVFMNWHAKSECSWLMIWFPLIWPLLIILEIPLSDLIGNRTGSAPHSFSKPFAKFFVFSIKVLIRSVKCVLARLLLLQDTVWTPTDFFLRWAGLPESDCCGQSVTALCYKNTSFSVLRFHSSMPTGEVCSDEGEVTLRSVSYRAAEGKEQPPRSSHKVKKQAKVAIPWLFFSLCSLVSQLLSPSGWQCCESLFQKWQGHEGTQTSLLFNESVVQIIKGFRSWQKSSTYMDLITQVLLPWFSLVKNI